MTLPQLLSVQNNLEMQLEDNGGELTPPLELMWNENQQSLQQKADSFGYLIKGMEGTIARLKELKEVATTKIKTTENRIDGIKQFMYHASGGNKLKGDVYSFSPYESNTREVNEIELKQEDFNYELKMDYNMFQRICKSVGSELACELDIIAKRKAPTVTQLPEGHSAIITHLKNTMRMR